MQGYSCRYIGTNDPFYDIIKDRAIKDFKELYNMSRKAYLVEYAIKTRVVVPTPNRELTEEELFKYVATTARNKIIANMEYDNTYPYNQDIVEIKQDTELPYDPINDSL